MAFWGKEPEVEADLRDILARVEALTPTWTTRQRERAPFDSSYEFHPELESRNVNQKFFPGVVYMYQILNDGPWCISMLFTESTPDGKLETMVNTAPHSAMVKVTLASAGDLVTLIYRDDADGRYREEHAIYYVEGGRAVATRINRASVHHIRQWVRRRVVPVLERTSAEMAREYRSEEERRTAQIDAMRKKYLP